MMNESLSPWGEGRVRVYIFANLTRAKSMQHYKVSLECPRL